MRIRRSRDEIRKIVEDFRASGMTSAEYSRQSGVALGTLNNYCRRERTRGLVRVDVEQRFAGSGGLTLVLAKGRRVEVGANFDGAELLRLIRVVEAA